jgi:hypothetical protein
MANALVAFDAWPVAMVDDESARASIWFYKGILCAYPQVKQRYQRSLISRPAMKAFLTSPIADV